MNKELKFVVENSKYVKINYEKIDTFINDLGPLNYKHWKEELELNLTEEEWILFCFIVESMNFCFWQLPKWKIKYKNEILSGSNALFYSICREVENNKDFLNLDYLYNLDIERFELIFESVEGKIPLLEERYNNFREVIDNIHSNENFYNDLYNIKNDIDLLNYIITNFKSFDDKSLYKNKIIHFNKRATLLVNDLYYVSEKIRINVGNVFNLGGCADYGIPRTFRDYGILSYNDKLAYIVDNNLLLEHDSEMEVEIRANMLFVIELIKERLKSKDIIISSVELDNLIWWIGKKYKKTNTHQTITIYY